MTKLDESPHIHRMLFHRQLCPVHFGDREQHDIMERYKVGARQTWVHISGLPPQQWGASLQSLKASAEADCRVHPKDKGKRPVECTWAGGFGQGSSLPDSFQKREKKKLACNRLGSPKCRVQSRTLRRVAGCHLVKCDRPCLRDLPSDWGEG